MGQDFFLQTLIDSVCKSYDEWHHFKESFYKHKEIHQANLNSLKENHIQVLLTHYDKKRFTNCKNLYNERVKFLNEVQQIVDNFRGV